MALPQDVHPGFFEVLATPRAYSTAFYLLVSLATGIFAFTFVLVGVSLSLGLAILILGIPVALAFLLAARALALGELWLIRELVVDPPLGTPQWLPPGEGLATRLKTLCTDRRTWTSLLYFLLKLPTGILGFTLMLVGLTLGLSLLAVPVAHLLHLGGTLSLDECELALFSSRPTLGLALCAVAGATILPLTLHLALALGRLQSWMARHLLLRA